MVVLNSKSEAMMEQLVHALKEEQSLLVKDLDEVLTAAIYQAHKSRYV